LKYLKKSFPYINLKPKESRHHRLGSFGFSYMAWNMMQNTAKRDSELMHQQNIASNTFGVKAV
jgi:hypothetical protein